VKILEKCPRCGYKLPKGKKDVIRIWASSGIEEQWEEVAKNYETKEIAFYEVLRKARLYDKLQLERSRIAVEPPTKP